MTVVNKAISMFKQDGFWHGLKKILNIIHLKLIKSEVVFVNKGSGDPVELERSDLVIRQAVADDFISSSIAFTASAETCLNRLAKNEIAYVAILNDEIVYIAWVRFIDELDISFVGQYGIKVPEQSLYVYDVFVVPHHRGLRVGGFMLDYYVALNPGRACYVAIQGSNESSLKMISKTDFRISWIFYWFKYGPISLKWKRTFDVIDDVGTV